MRTYTPRKAAQGMLEGAPPDVLACYDNGGKSLDRYTILFTSTWNDHNGIMQIDAYAASENPFDAHGFGLHVSIPAHARSRIGRNMRWLDLPEKVRAAITQEG